MVFNLHLVTNEKYIMQNTLGKSKSNKKQDKIKKL